jgi:hypothetical protein
MAEQPRKLGLWTLALFFKKTHGPLKGFVDCSGHHEGLIAAGAR